MQKPVRLVKSEIRDIEERVPPVLSNRGFRFLWLAQIISQTAQNAILYALIVVVTELTKSTTSTSAVVLSFVIPIIVFGLFAGLLVDRYSKRKLLIATNAARALATVAFFFGREHVWALYVTTAFFASFSQLFTTTTAASIPFMVSRKQLISANSLFSGGFTIAQISGLIVLSPLILKTGGPAALFACAFVAFAAAAGLARFLPYIGAGAEEEHEQALPGRDELRGAVSEFWKALSSLRADPRSMLAMAHITMSSTLILLFAILVPRYMQAILEVNADNTVTIFAPVAIGALIGLRAVPMIVSRLGKTKTVVVGLFGLALCLAALGFVETIGDALQGTDRFNPFGPERFFGLTILGALTMLFAGPLGFSYALLNTPAQTILHERTPVEMRGRVIASQMVLANGVALIPLVVAGGVADLYGVSSVILALGVLLAIGGAVSLYLERQWLSSKGDSPPASGSPGADWRPEGVSTSIDTT